MKPDKRAPMDFSVANAQELAVEPDNDLEVPAIDVSPVEPLGSLAPANLELAPAEQALAEPARRSVAPREDGGGPAIYLIAALGSLAWAALAAYAVGYGGIPAGTLTVQPLQTALLVAVVLAPVVFIWVAAYCLRQGARLAGQLARSRALAEDMLEPAAIAAAEAGSTVESVRLEIVAAAEAASQARTELLNLRRAIAEETEGLWSSTKVAAKQTNILTSRLTIERQELDGLAQSLGARAVEVETAITRHAKMVAEASDLAQTQIGEAEAALAARAADLASAAADAHEAARLASEDLARQGARLETATIGVGDQIRSMEDTLTQQRAALVAVANTVRSDHEDFSLKIETQRAQLAEILAGAQISVEDLHEAASSAAEALSELTAAAAAQSREFVDTAKAERDQLAASALQSLGALSEAARFEREAMERDVDQSLQVVADASARERQALDESVQERLAALVDAVQVEREALHESALRSLETMSEAAAAASRTAEGYNDAARMKLEALAEAAFAASQQAEAAFESRLSEAGDLIDRSAELVDKAATKTAARIEQAAAAARATLAQMEAAVEEFEARVAELPARAGAQADQLRATLSGGFDGLLASARAAAEETQAIDAAFQERVRRNYEMLSEAVRLMGVVSARPGPGVPSPAASALAARTTAPEPPAAKEPAPEPASREEGPDQPAAPPERPGRRFGFSPRTPSAEGAGLRPRLKLAPTTADAKVSSVFEPSAEAAPAAEGGEWTWQELLSSMEDAPVEQAQLADRLIGEIEALGVDLAALLPPPRLEEIAAVMEAGDAAGARTVVRYLAPAAVRRLSRRIMAEKPLRKHAESFVKRYGAALEKGLSEKGRDGVTAVGLLATEDGRTFLLFDAALGDLR